MTGELPMIKSLWTFLDFLERVNIVHPELGRGFHRLRFVVTDISTETPYYLMRVFGIEFFKRKELIYFGMFESVKVNDFLVIDSKKPNSIFEIGKSGNRFFVKSKDTSLLEIIAIPLTKLDEVIYKTIDLKDSEVKSVEE